MKTRLVARDALPIVLLLLLVVVTSGCPGRAPGRDRDTSSGGSSDPLSKRARELDDARALFDLADKQNPDDKIRTYEQIVRDYPNSELCEEVYFQLCHLYCVRQRLDDAQRVCITFLNLFPDSVNGVYFPLQFLLDNALYQVKKAPPEQMQAAEENEKAVIDLGVKFLTARTAKKKPSEDSSAYLYFARYLYAQGSLDETIRAASSLIDAFPDSEGDERGKFMQAGVPEALELRATALRARAKSAADVEAGIRDLDRLLVFLREGSPTDLGNRKTIDRVEKQRNEMKSEPEESPKK